jgi:mannosyltransferase
MSSNKKFLLVIFLLGLLLRCINLEGRSIQYDDAFSFFLASQNPAAIVKGTAADTMPPLYYFFLHFWMLLSQQLWFLRLLSILLSMGSVGVVFLITRRLVGSNAGLFAAFLAAISPFQIYHAQDLRMYALLCLGQAGYTYFFIRFWQNSQEDEVTRWYEWTGLILCGMIAMYSHNLAVFVLVVPDIYLVLKRKWKILSRLLAAQVVIGLLALPWLWLVPGQIAKIQKAFWTPRPGLVEIIQAVIMFTATLPLPGFWLLVGAILSLWVLVIITMETWRNRNHSSGLTLLLGLTLLPPILLFIASYIMRPVFVPRAFIFSSLMYYGVAGWVISKSWPKGASSLVAAGFIIAAVIALPYQQYFTDFPRSPFKDLANALRLKIDHQPGSVVVHDNKLSYFPTRFFAPDLPQKFLADEPGSSNDTLALTSQQAMQTFPEQSLQIATQGYREVYFVVFSQTIDEYKRSGLPNHPQLEWLQKNMKEKTVFYINDLEIYEFSPR